MNGWLKIYGHALDCKAAPCMYLKLSKLHRSGFGMR